MVAMDHLLVIRDIELKKYRSIYLLHGDEPWFADQICDYMSERILDENERTFGLHVVYGKDVSLEQVLQLAKSYPMLGERQVIIVKEAQELKEFKTRGESDESEEEEKKKKSSPLASFEAYIENPQPTSILVFVFRKTFDKRLKAYKMLEKKALIFESQKIRDYKLPQWIDNYVRSKGLRINLASSELLAEHLGNDLSKVVNEIDKLAIALPAGSEISGQIIEEYIGISKDYNINELQRSIAVRDVLKANRIINYFDSNPKAVPIQMVIPSIYNQFLRLMIFHGLEDKSKAATQMGLYPAAMKEMQELSKAYSVQKSERIIGYLRDADKKSKGIGRLNMTNHEILQELLFKILH